jgi:NAD(P)H-hydrate epimerase
MDRQLPDAAASRERDRLACAAAGDGGLAFMERAAEAACGLILADRLAGPVVVLAGGGNNGGDALALARLMAASGLEPEVWHIPGPSGRTSTNWRVQAGLLEVSGIITKVFGDGTGPALEASLATAGLIVDGIAGIGQSGPLEGAPARVVRLLDGLAGRAPVLALDLPSGLRDGWRAGELAVRADRTICFDHPKRCLYQPSARPFAGEILVAGIGFPAAWSGTDDGTPVGLLLDSDLPGLLPAIPPDSHKFGRGSLAVLAGSRRYPGAALLTAGAAARSRAGMVRLLADPDLASALLPVAGELLVEPLDPGRPPDAAALGRADAAIAGPGWGRGPERPGQLAALFAALAERDIPLVLDADGLHALARLPTPPAHAGLILTPHAGELAALAGTAVAEILDDPAPVLSGVARRYGATVLLKGAVSWIAGPDGAIDVLDAANPALAQAGTGDVLAGVMGAVLAGLTRSGKPAENRCRNAARAACLVLARAGREMVLSVGWGSSRELVQVLPRVWAEIDPPALRGTVWLAGTDGVGVEPQHQGGDT